MENPSEKRTNSNHNIQRRLLLALFPFVRWFPTYNFSVFGKDFLAGITVALVLIPQSMAYAQLAGLQAYYGLYAAFLPPMIAALFGSSNQLATGPVAVVSLMTATALEPLATAGSSEFLAYAILLALCVGIFQTSLGVLRLGVVVNFLSHPVVNGFTNAAAIIIATSQLSKLFGVDVDSAEHHYQTVINTCREALHYTHWPTLALAILAFAIMIAVKRVNRRIPNVLVAVVITSVISWAIGFEKTQKWDLNCIASGEVHEAVGDFNDTLGKIEKEAGHRLEIARQLEAASEEHGPHSEKAITARHQLQLLAHKIGEIKARAADCRARLRAFKLEKAGDRFFLSGQIPEGLTGDGRVWRLKVGNTAVKAISCGGAVVGSIPKGLPKFSFPKVDFKVALQLLPMVVIISLLGFMEAISIAKAMATKTGQRLDPNQELIGQGLANIVGSCGQAYPASGSFSRSAVNIQAGAVTGMSNVMSSAVVVAVLLFFTPLLYHLPQSVLAAIIMMAVAGLINIRGFVHSWHAQKYDGVVSVVSFLCTLGFAPHLDRGIFIGVMLSLGLYLLRTMKPDIAMLSRYTDGSYRNAGRFNLAQCRHIAVVRFNGSLFFANTSYLEEQVLDRVSAMPELKHVLIVGNGINELDASGEEMLSIIVRRLREAGYDVSLSGLNDSVLDVLRRTHLYERIGDDHFFRSVAGALDKIFDETHTGSDEYPCPLLKTTFKGLPVAGAVKLD